MISKTIGFRATQHFQTHPYPSISMIFRWQFGICPRTSPFFRFLHFGWSITQFAIIQSSFLMLQCSTFAGSVIIFSHLIFIFDGGTIILVVKPSYLPVHSPSLLVEPSFFWWNPCFSMAKPWFLLLNSSPIPRISLTRPLHRKSCRFSGGNSGGPAANAAEPEATPPAWPAGGGRREGMGSTCARHLVMWVRWRDLDLWCLLDFVGGILWSSMLFFLKVVVYFFKAELRK